MGVRKGREGLRGKRSGKISVKGIGSVSGQIIYLAMREKSKVRMEKRL